MFGLHEYEAGADDALVNNLGPSLPRDISTNPFFETADRRFVWAIESAGIVFRSFVIDT